MKKVLAIAALGMITLASCKKDYSCVCTADETFFNQTVEYKDMKKKDAEDACSTNNTNYANTVDGGKCELK